MKREELLRRLEALLLDEDLPCGAHEPIEEALRALAEQTEHTAAQAGKEE
jgi:hypothetical protein